MLKYSYATKRLYFNNNNNNKTILRHDTATTETIKEVNASALNVQCRRRING